MTKRERIKAAVNREEVDRIPISFWRHFPVIDRNQKVLAESLIHFQKTYDLDFVKMMPNGLYSAMDFGIQIADTTSPEETDQVKSYGIEKPEDWERLKKYNPEVGSFFQQLESLALVFNAVGKSVPVVGTIFSPLTTAMKIAGSKLVSHIREHPEKVHAGLEYLSEITVNFVHRCLDLGVDGIFFATQCATSQVMTEEEYNLFGRPYDLKVLEAARPFWFNILHIHGQKTFNLFNYPVAAVNYHDRHSERSFRDCQSLFPGALMGGIDETNTLLNGPTDLIRQEIEEAVGQLDGRGVIIGPGCVINTRTPENFLHTARQAVSA